MKKHCRRSCLGLWVLALCLALGLAAHAQAPAPAQTPAAAPAAAPAPAAAADAQLRDAAGKAPTMMDLQKGDPGGAITGTSPLSIMGDLRHRSAYDTSSTFPLQYKCSRIARIRTRTVLS